MYTNREPEGSGAPVWQSDRAQFHFAFLFLQQEVTHKTKILLFFSVLGLSTVQWLKKHDERQKEKSSLSLFLFLFCFPNSMLLRLYNTDESKKKSQRHPFSSRGGGWEDNHSVRTLEQEGGGVRAL